MSRITNREGRPKKLVLCRTCGEEFAHGQLSRGGSQCSFCRAQEKPGAPTSTAHPSLIEFLYRRPAA